MSELVAVVGAVGGVGASTLAALLATHRSVRGPTAVVDLQDPGGIETLLGIEDRPGLRWPELRQVRGELAAEDLTGQLPRWRDVAVLSATRGGGASTAAIVPVCRALQAHHMVVLDVPPWRLAALADLLTGGRAVLVTGQDVCGVAAALTVLPALRNMRTELVLRRRRHSRVAACEAAAVLRLNLAGCLPQSSAMAAAVEVGLGPLGSRRLARAVARIERVLRA